MKRAPKINTTATPARIEQLTAALIEAGGNPVRGRRLAEIADIKVDQLPNLMRVVAARRPDLQVQSIRPHGYRAAALGPVTIDLGPGSQPDRNRPRSVEPLHVRHRRGLDLMALLDTGFAEKVRSVALESEESLLETVHRLLSYGIEVHHCLISEGEHPVRLRRAA
jgi:hypothetical protein